MTISIPTGWNEVSLSQYQEIGSLQDNEHKTNSVIAILSDQDEDVISKMTVECRMNVLTHLTWIYSPPSDEEYKRKITIDGTDFYLKDYNELTVGERIDLKEYCKKATENLHKIFAILYKPEKEVRDLAELFQDKLMIGDCYGAMVFFYRIANKSLKILQDFLMEELSRTEKKLMKSEKKD